MARSKKPRVMFQLYLDPAQYEYIVGKAEKTKRSRASILREIIDRYLELEREEVQC